MASRAHENGWISVEVPIEWESKAREIRAKRDQRYGNIYPESRTDQRWVGDLGEIVFKSWLNHQCIRDYKWFTDDAAGNADFEIGPGVSVGVKTVKRKDMPRPGYTMQITAQHAHEPVQQFFFLTYEFLIRRMWLLGGISRDEFLEVARYYRDGDFVHSHYQVRGHDIYNADIDRFQPPAAWIRNILGIEGQIREEDA